MRAGTYRTFRDGGWFCPTDRLGWRWSGMQSEQTRSSWSRQWKQNVRPQYMHRREAGAPHF
jgi:hypothetical protein